jgi:hypothetical protein
MERQNPHFLRVVQALAFVTGAAPVAILTGASLLGGGCSSSSIVSGVLPCPSDASCGATYDGSPTGAFDGFVTGVVINPDASGGGIQPPPGDASDDVTLVGGPLLPPELPA